MTHTKKGFTLIELLVVIAIIGILSSVVLASLNSARGKGSNAAVKSNLNNLRAQAELIYDQNNGKYTAGLCTEAHVKNMLDAAGIAGSGVATDAVCNSDDNSWAASAPLKIPDSDGSTFWCVDNGGTAHGTNAALGAGVMVCP